MSQEQEKFLENLLKDNLFFQNFYQEWLEDMEKEKEKEKEKEEAKEKNKEKEITKENKAKMEKKEKKEKKETILYYCPFCGEKIAGFYYHIDTYHEEKEKEILIKISYRQLKSVFKENGDIKIIVDFLYEPKIRVLWDKVLKTVEVLEGDKKTNYICSTWAKSPTFFMSERESLEKRFIYKDPNNNSFYIMSSSIPDELFPSKKEVVRITNYCNYYKITDEGEYIGFYSLNQTDFKMSIPQFLINVTLPTTTKNWQVDLEKFAGEVKYDENTSNITYINQKK